MDSYNNISIDADSLENSRGETLVDRLRDEIRQKQNIVDEKNKIIASLRGQVEDLQQENEEFERNEQLLKQKFDRCKKELDERNEELEAVSRTVHEVETANEQLKQRLDARIGQLQKYVDELKQTKMILNEVHSKNEQLQNQNERLAVELESLNRKQNLRTRERECDEAESRDIVRLKEELNVAETSWKLERQHKERYAKENCQLGRRVHELTKELNAIKDSYGSLEGKYFEVENRLREILSTPATMLPPTSASAKRNFVPAQNENRSELTSAIQFSVADEVGEIMDSSSIAASVKEKRCLNESKLWDQHGLAPKRAALDNETFMGKPSIQSRNYPTNQNATRSQLFTSDPIMEQKMRLARASELARRNNLTKPLHQTSYPLELDTFDTTDLTENDIKRGNVPRQALSDFSNQTRKPVKKAEAFIV